MAGTRIDEDLIKRTVEFHGHWCPGLAIGIRAAELALDEVGKASDEDIVAVVETDMCGVDAIQFLTCCTFGKGNLIHRDYGKNAFSFYRRKDDKSIRIITRATAFGDLRDRMIQLQEKAKSEGLTKEEEEEMQGFREKLSAHIMESELANLFEVKKPNEPVPQKARIMESLICESCGEPTMEARIRRAGEKAFCIPCFESLEAN